MVHGEGPWSNHALWPILMSMRALGYPLAVLGTYVSWRAFHAAFGQMDVSSVARWTAFSICLLGLAMILGSGYLLNRPAVRGFVVPGFALLAEAGLLWFTRPIANDDPTRDHRTLYFLMGAGVSLSFGMALMVAAFMAAMIGQSRR